MGLTNRHVPDVANEQKAKMTDLTPELGLDVIDEWFKIGKKSVQKNIKTVPRSVTGGRYFDFATQKPRVAEVDLNSFHLQRYV